MMRGLPGLWLSTLLILCVPLCEGAVNPVPVLSIALDQPSVAVNASNYSQSVTFTGHAGVDKLPVERVTVQLTASTDKGWSAVVNPSQMIFTSTTPQSFTSTVTVPAKTQGDISAKLTIGGTATAMFLTSTTETTALVAVSGTLPSANQTGNATNVTKGSAGTNQTANAAGTGSAGGGTDKFLGLGQDQLMMAGAAVIILSAASVTGLYVRARRARRAVYEINSTDYG